MARFFFCTVYIWPFGILANYMLLLHSVLVHTTSTPFNCNFVFVSVNGDYKYCWPQKKNQIICMPSIHFQRHSKRFKPKKKNFWEKIAFLFVALLLTFKNYDHTNAAYYHNGLKCGQWNWREATRDRTFDRFSLKRSFLLGFVVFRRDLLVHPQNNTTVRVYGWRFYFYGYFGYLWDC